MALAERDLERPKTLTYEDYLAEGEMKGRYDIVDGVRLWMPSPTDSHQQISLNIAFLFRKYQTSTGAVKAFIPPIDILIQRAPLKTRQPDVMLVSKSRYEEYRKIDKPGWEVGPELTVEVISPSNSKRSITKKMLDYANVGVNECWIVHPNDHKIEQWQLSLNEPENLVNTFIEGQALSSTAFPELEIEVASIFEF